MNVYCSEKEEHSKWIPGNFSLNIFCVSKCIKMIRQRIFYSQIGYEMCVAVSFTYLSACIAYIVLGDHQQLGKSITTINEVVLSIDR